MTDLTELCERHKRHKENIDGEIKCRLCDMEDRAAPVFLRNPELLRGAQNKRSKNND